MSSQIKSLRSSLEEDEDLAVLMAGLRGSNIDESDFATEGLQMKLVSVSEDADDLLPLEYDPDLIAAYWSVRPVSVMKRILQLLGESNLRVGSFPWACSQREDGSPTGQQFALCFPLCS